MAHPPYFMRERESQRIFRKSYDELSDNEQILVDDMCWEYSGCSPEEAEREEWERKNGRYAN